MSENNLVPCACGCGKLLVPFDKRGRPRKFLPSHYSRVQPSLQESTACENCGKPVRRAQWQLKRIKHVFCDHKCTGEYMAKHGLRQGERNGRFNSVTVPCAGCGAPVSKAHSLIYRRNNRVYCPDCQSPKLESGKPVTWLDYPPEFTKALRHQIRVRDNYICQECGGEQGTQRGFPIHHIDYNKHNCDPLNLVTLCCSCHARTQFARTQWTERLQALMLRRFPR